MKPCPECGDGDCLLVVKNLPSEEWSVYCGCGHNGRLYKTRVEAIEAHNALPRALRWTTEPPSVAGWYWWDNGSVQSLARVRVVDGKLYMTDYGCRDIKIHDCDLVERWAGPIPAPVEE